MSKLAKLELYSWTGTSYGYFEVLVMQEVGISKCLSESCPESMWGTASWERWWGSEMSSKTRASKKRVSKKANGANEPALLPKEFVTRVLGDVPRENGFYFYSSMGNPTGAVACSFDEFCQSVKSAPSDTIEFHLSRGDFENWIRFLGDQELASQIEGLRGQSLPRGQLVQTFVSTIEKRRDLLRKSA